MRHYIIIILIACCPLWIPCSTVNDAPQTENVAQVAVVDGSLFNPYFPADEGEFTVVYTQERPGFAEASLKKGGTEVATLAVSDTANNPSAADKFNSSSIMIAGFPATNSGKLGTAILVDGRFQVQVRSKDNSFSQADREAWLTKFNLNGLAGLE